MGVNQSPALHVAMSLPRDPLMSKDETPGETQGSPKVAHRGRGRSPVSQSSPSLLSVRPPTDAPPGVTSPPHVMPPLSLGADAPSSPGLLSSSSALRPPAPRPRLRMSSVPLDAAAAPRAVAAVDASVSDADVRPVHWGDAGLRALVVEDNRLNVMVLRRMLRKIGLDCDVATDGGDALRLLNSAHDPPAAAAATSSEPGRARYAVVLMDLHMPGMDGLEATRQLRALEREHGWARVPVVAVTASVAADTEPVCIAAGMDGFLTKPVTLDALTHILPSFFSE
jgi:CheY-like chemotaxis protein